MRGRRLRGLVLHHRRHPSAHPQETCNKDHELGRVFCSRRLPLVPRAHLRHTSHLARLLPCGIPRPHPDRSHPASRSRCARAVAVLPRSSTTGSRSTSPGRWDPRRSGGRSPWRTCTGSAAPVTGARPGWTEQAGAVPSRPARSTGGEPGRAWRINRAWADVFLGSSRDS